MSRIDFTPLDTTVTGFRPNSVRSALTSIVVSPPRCTPPRPPTMELCHSKLSGIILNGNYRQSTEKGHDNRKTIGETQRWKTTIKHTVLIFLNPLPLTWMDHKVSEAAVSMEDAIWHQSCSRRTYFVLLFLIPSADLIPDCRVPSMFSWMLCVQLHTWLVWQQCHLVFKHILPLVVAEAKVYKR